MKACWSGRGQPVPEVAPDRVCRVCGCSEFDPCETAEGPCGWAGAELCTACDGRPAELYVALDALAAAAAAVAENDRTLERGDAVDETSDRKLRVKLRRALKEAQKVLRVPDRRMG